MSDLRKAAEMALDSMEFLIYHLRNHHRCKHLDTTWNPTMSEKVDKSFESLRQALAQPEQEPVAAVVSWEKSMITRLTEHLEPATFLYTAPPSIEAAVLAEREACLKEIAIELNEWNYGTNANIALNNVYAAIRARSEK